MAKRSNKGLQKERNRNSNHPHNDEIYIQLMLNPEDWMAYVAKQKCHSKNQSQLEDKKCSSPETCLFYLYWQRMNQFKLVKGGVMLMSGMTKLTPDCA